MGKILAGQKVTAAALNALPADLASLTTGSVANSITETTIGTFSSGIAANDPAVNGGYDAMITGTQDVAAATPTLRFRVYVGTAASSNRVFDSGVLTTSGTGTARPFWIRAFLIVTATGVTGTFDSGGLISAAGFSVSLTSSNFTAGTIDTTAAHDVILTALWGTANAGNIARTTAGLLQRM